jgi:hypothetical protein
MDLEVDDLDAEHPRADSLFRLSSGDAMNVLTALRRAINQTGGVWRYGFLVYAWNLALAACLGAMVYGAIDRSLGSSLAGERMWRGFDSMWFNSFSVSAARGPAATFTPSVSGSGAVLDAVDAFLDGFSELLRGSPGTGLAPVALVYLVSWTLFAGGFIGLFAGIGPPIGFVRHAVRHFPAFLLISLVGLAFYAVVLGPLRGWLDGVRTGSLHDTIDERIRFAYTLAEYGALWMALSAGNLVLDYTKVAVVHRGGVQPVRDVPMAAGRALGLIIGHPLKTGGLYVLTTAAGVVGAVIYAAVAPGGDIASPGALVVAFVLGQAYILSRVLLRCMFYAGESAMYGAMGVVRSGCPAAGVLPQGGYGAPGSSGV